MATITQITPQAKDKSRCSVYLDGKFYCGLKLEVAVKNRLQAGMHVEQNELDEMQFDSEKASAFDRALTHLSASMKTAKEMEDYLRKKGYVQPVIDYVMEKLKGYAFVDDAEYARQYLASAGKSKGKRLLALELRRKGVKDEEAEIALAELENEEESAKAVFRKYMRGKEFNKQNLSKAFQHLLSRGFEYEVAKDALGEIDDDN